MARKIKILRLSKIFKYLKNNHAQHNLQTFRQLVDDGLTENWNYQPEGL